MFQADRKAGSVIGRRCIYLLLALLVMGLAGCAKDSYDETPADTTATGVDYPLTLTPDRMPMAVVGHSYYFELKVYGNTNWCNRDHFEWTEPTPLPPGLKYSVSTGDIRDTLMISGTPTTPGTYSFDVNVQNFWCNRRGLTEQRTIVVADSLDLTGDWLFAFTVAEFNSDCTGETVGDYSTETIHITQNGESLVLDGFGDDNAWHIHGNLVNWNGVLASGVYPEDNGGTTTEHNLTLYTKNDMSGYESWKWESGIGVGGCSGARSLVTATRIP